MKAPLPPLVVIALLGACHGPAPAPKATDADQAIAMVERAQHAQAPLQPLRLGSVSFADIRKPAADLHMPSDLGNPHDGDGCSFFVPGDGRKPVLVAVSKAALIHEAGGWELFAADSGSKAVPEGLHVAYSSAKHTLRVASADRDRTTVTVRDKYDRVVWQATGRLRCKS